LCPISGMAYPAHAPCPAQTGTVWLPRPTASAFGCIPLRPRGLVRITHPDQGLQPWDARPGWSGYIGSPGALSGFVTRASCPCVLFLAGLPGCSEPVNKPRIRPFRSELPELEALATTALPGGAAGYFAGVLGPCQTLPPKVVANILS
jgi:hypothetical protein